MNPDSTSGQRPQKLRERMKEAVRAAILEAAEAVLSEQGLHRARMEEIAARAGVSVGTLYNYFEDREALLGALRENLREDLVARLDTVVGPAAEEGPFVQRLERYLRELTGYLQAHWRMFALLEEEAEPVSRKRSALKAAHQRVEELIQRGVQEGALRKEDAALYPALLTGLVRGAFSRSMIEKEPPSPEQLVPALLRFFLEGAGVRR